MVAQSQLILSHLTGHFVGTAGYVVSAIIGRTVYGGLMGKTFVGHEGMATAVPTEPAALFENGPFQPLSSH